MSYKLIFNALFILCALTACDQKTSIVEGDIRAEKPASLLSQHIIEINNTVDGELNKEDLARFAEQLGNARIVGLGEQTHGTSETFALKSQLIQYLHQEHDFDVFILESGMFEIDTLWQQAKNGQRIKDNAPKNIFYMYANSDEVTPLYDYINKQVNTDRPLTFLGFDSQHSGELSNKYLIKDLEKFLTLQDYIFPENWSVFKQQLQHVLNVSTERLTTDNEQAFFVQLLHIQQTLLSSSQQAQNTADSKNDNRNQAGFWYRISRGLEAQAKRQWQITDTRSEEMGINIEWWASQYQDKKIIVWAHSGHLYRIGYEGINAGQVLSERFGKQYYMVHFTSNSGQFLDFIDMEVKNVTPTNEHSFEQMVTQTSKTELSFVNIAPPLLITAELKNEKTGMFGHDYRATLPLEQWDAYIDGVFVFKQITPAQYK